ncbi:MAG TPA: putative ABC exporter domain-containing protein [Gemmatimonadaceae bacterium]|nr:putative ABC exporter domain-containing protein [Gemmatimonadaceae bacterium]
MIGAFGYLIGTSTRNRLRGQLKRIRNPRYAIAFLVGAAYFAFVIFGRSLGRSRGVTYGTSGTALAPLFIVVMVVSSWLLSADASALAFTQAEVSMLFTAPVTRRGLIIYKLVRAQIAILVSAMLMVFFLGRGSSTIPHVLAGLGYWTMLSTINMHGVGAALVRARSDERSRTSPGLRRTARMLALVVSMMIMFAIMGPVMTGGHPSDAGPFGFLANVAAYLDRPVPHAILTPFRMVVAPAFAVSVGDWVKAFGPALLIMLLHLVWVMNADAAFEEAAAEASERRAKRIEQMRSRRGNVREVPTEAVRTIALASSGNPALAIVWKNTLALGRMLQLNQLLMPVVMSIVVSTSARRGVGDTAQSVAVGVLFFTLMLAITGALVVRNDLRSDMLHLPFLKTVPLRGREIVLAEVASGALPLTALQLVLVGIAAIALSMSASPVVVSATFRGALLVSAPFVLLAFNGAVFALLNGTAVLFPAWIKLGPTGGGGIELMGQAMMSMFGVLICVLLLLVAPVAGVAAIFSFLEPTGLVAIAGTVIAGAAILAAEAYGIIALLGRSFERAEPSSVT